MAQQLKFVACLKILMEELSTLATGFEVDGGQLRYQLYVWLEREVDALRQLCSYSVNADGDVTNTTECNVNFILTKSSLIILRSCYLLTKFWFLRRLMCRWFFFIGYVTVLNFRRRRYGRRRTPVQTRGTADIA